MVLFTFVSGASKAMNNRSGRAEWTYWSYHIEATPSSPTHELDPLQTQSMLFLMLRRVSSRFRYLGHPFSREKFRRLWRFLRSDKHLQNLVDKVLSSGFRILRNRCSARLGHRRLFGSGLRGGERSLILGLLWSRVYLGLRCWCCRRRWATKSAIGSSFKV